MAFGINIAFNEVILKIVSLIYKAWFCPMKNFIKTLLFTSFCTGGLVQAHGPNPVPLKGAPLPPLPAELLDSSDPIIIDKDKAIILGKALFWDTAVGSDGTACGTCHFHAGADSRVKNQLNPGSTSPAASGETFETTASNAPGGPNYTLTRSDFPFHQKENPFDINSPVTFDTDDTVSSSGTFSGEFNSAPRTGDINEDCSHAPDSIFHVNNTNTRRVEPRNTPTVINAVFNHRNFWDGRANNTFNGVNNWGDRDTDAGVWVKINGRTVVKQRMALTNSSLASQAVAPPLSDTEMGCRQRRFEELGRKLLFRRPLEHQKVHYQDSVLGALSYSDATANHPGLNTTYETLVKQAFNKKYWSYRRRGPFGGAEGQLPYTQMEANFSMFFGLAIQMYESTLISDDAPIDNATFDDIQLPTSLGESVKRGAKLFEVMHCNSCHSGPALTTNAILTNAQMLENDTKAFNGPASGNLKTTGADGVALNRNIVNYDSATGTRFIDTGFSNTGIRDPNGDPGVNGVDAFGNPLSFSAQYAEYISGTPNAIIDLEAGIENVKSCNFQAVFASTSFYPPFLPPITDNFRPEDGLIPDPHDTSNCFLGIADAYLPLPAVAAAELADPNTKKMAMGNQAAFKVPTLRNIELTGPYMHNGGLATLEETLDFYARGGNFPNTAKHGFVTPLVELVIDETLNPSELAARLQNRADVIAFLKSLTDDRVKYERAPFDHPEITIPVGHSGDENSTINGNTIDPNLAADETITIPAVGAHGRATPLKPFEELLAP